MTSQLKNERCCIKHCWDVYEQNSSVNSVRVNFWTAEWTIIALKYMRFDTADIHWIATQYDWCRSTEWITIGNAHTCKQIEGCWIQVRFENNKTYGYSKCTLKHIVEERHLVDKKAKCWYWRRSWHQFDFHCFIAIHPKLINDIYNKKWHVI